MNAAHRDLSTNRSSNEDIEKAAAFLEGLGSLISLSAIVPDGPIASSALEFPEAAEKLRLVLRRAQTGGNNLYFVLNEPRKDLPRDKRPKEDEIALLRGVAVDVDPDPAEEAKPGGYATERKRLLAMADDALRHPTCPPTAAIDSGNGVQLIWLFVDPIENTSQNRELVKAQAKGLAARLGGDAVQSVEHLFRVPYTPNLPNAVKRAKGRKATRSLLIDLHATRRYSLNALAAVAPPLEARPAPVVQDDEIDVHTVLDAAAGGPEHLSAKLQDMHRRLKDRKGFQSALGNRDRSERDYAIAAQCIDLGMDDPTEIGQLTFAVSPEKLTEKEESGKGSDYAKRTVFAALENERARREKHFSAIDGEPAPVTVGALHETRRLRLYSLDEIKDMPPLEYLVDRHIPKAGLAFLYGKPGSGKSFLALDIALHVAWGMPDWHGDEIRAAHKGRVLYIAGEGSTGTPARVKAWEHGRFLPIGREARLTFLLQAVNFLAADKIRELIDALKSSGHEAFDLIIVDTVSRAVAGADENAAKDLSLFVENCNLLQRTFRSSVLAIHHPDKQGKGMRGSGATEGGADAILRLERSSREYARLTSEKQKDGSSGWADRYGFKLVRFQEGKGGESLVPLRMQSEDRKGENAVEAKAIAKAIVQALDGSSEAKLSSLWKLVVSNAEALGTSVPGSEKHARSRIKSALGSKGVDLDQDGKVVRVCAENRSGGANGVLWLTLQEIKGADE